VVFSCPGRQTSTFDNEATCSRSAWGCNARAGASCLIASAQNRLPEARFVKSKSKRLDVSADDETNVRLVIVCRPSAAHLYIGFSALDLYFCTHWNDSLKLSIEGVVRSTRALLFSLHRAWGRRWRGARGVTDLISGTRPHNVFSPVRTGRPKNPPAGPIRN